MGILSVSVDLDEVRCYHDIHGLKTPNANTDDLICRRALPRIGELFDKLNIKGTFFAVGRDLREDLATAGLLKGLADKGHEIANHTMNHRYDLTVLPPNEQRAEISNGADAIAQAIGKRPKGFRAPGYNVHLGLLDIVEELGYKYDSSVFPCPAYLAAKTAAIGIKSALGAKSQSLIGDPRILLAPTGPYRLGRDGVWTKGDGMYELPISVVTAARIPFIGTTLSLMGRRPASIMAKVIKRSRFLNLELHAIDFIDADGDGLGYLAAHQPDLKISYTKKLATLTKVLEVLINSGMSTMSLYDASQRVFI